MPPFQRVLVAGAGAAGLRTALELSRAGKKVWVHAKEHFLDASNTSQGAGGLWMPYHCDDSRTNQWALETLHELWSLACGDQTKDLVEIVPALCLHKTHTGPTMQDFMQQTSAIQASQTKTTSRLPLWRTDARLEFQHMTVEMLTWQNIVYKLRIPSEQELKEAGYQYCWLFKAPVVDPPKMLQYYSEQLEENGGDVDLHTGHEYESLAEMCAAAEALDCDTLVNCTGLGAQKLCQDQTLLPARGILHLYERTSCVRRTAVQQNAYGQNIHDAVIMVEEPPWGSETEPAYLIPRGNVIVVGGSYLENDAENSIRPFEQTRLQRNALHLGIDISLAKRVGEWTGFRPSRPTVRCEVDDLFRGGNGKVRVAHCYGFGGSGWTINVGAAREVVQLLQCT